MIAQFDPFLKTWRWPALALAAAAFMLGAAHVFENVFNFAPCPLCLRQREIYWAEPRVHGGPDPWRAKAA
jgi:disulfide bond formation protein DsbB